MSALELDPEAIVESRVRSLTAAFGFAAGAAVEGGPVAAYAHAIKIGVELGRELVQLHEDGRISRASIDLLFDTLDDGLARMVELMPPDPPRPR